MSTMLQKLIQVFTLAVLISNSSQAIEFSLSGHENRKASAVTDGESSTPPLGAERLGVETHGATNWFGVGPELGAPYLSGWQGIGAEAPEWMVRYWQGIGAEAPEWMVRYMDSLAQKLRSDSRRPDHSSAPSGGAEDSPLPLSLLIAKIRKASEGNIKGVRDESASEWDLWTYECVCSESECTYQKVAREEVARESGLEKLRRDYVLCIEGWGMTGVGHYRKQEKVLRDHHYWFYPPQSHDLHPLLQPLIGRIL